MNTQCCLNGLSLRIGLRRLAALLTACGLGLAGSAADLRLTIETARVAEGFVAELVPGLSGDIIVSGDFRQADDQGGERRPHIAVLNPAGQVVQRLNPPSISLSSQPLYLHWRIRAQLPDGTFLVDDESFPPPRMPRFRMYSDGTPIRDFVVLPSGPVALQRNGWVLSGVRPGDNVEIGGPLVRWNTTDFFWNLNFDRSFTSNVVKVFPTGDVYCARLAVNEDDSIWVWLAEPGSGQARLHRLLPDGRPDPAFQPTQAVETTERFGAVLNYSYGLNTLPVATWLGPLPGGGVMILAESASPQDSLVVRRLDPDGTVDHTFEWPLQGWPLQYPEDTPLLTLPDGSLLVESPKGSGGPKVIFRVRPGGTRDPSWEADFGADQLSSTDGSFPTKLVRQADGKLVGIRDHGSGRVGRTRLFRINPDGSFDSTFDAAVASPSPVRELRLFATGLQPGRNYILRETWEAEGLSGGFNDVRQSFFFGNEVVSPVKLAELQLGPASPVQRFWRLDAE